MILRTRCAKNHLLCLRGETALHTFVWSTLFLTLFVTACRFVSSQDSNPSMVAAAHPLAAQAGLDVLRKGGNAMDAAVATAFTLGVVEPHASGIGGGGFLLYYDAESGEVEVVDYREVAPRGLKEEQYTTNNKLSKRKMKRGGLSVAVPGMVRGLVTAHQRYGGMDFSTLLEQAVLYAEEGFPVSQQLNTAISYQLEYFEKNKAAAAVFLEEGMFPRDIGMTLVQSDLASTLRAIQKKGPDAIYGKEPARRIAAAVQEEGGMLTDEEITAYKPRLREPIRGTYRGYELLSIGPPSSGGIAVIQILNIVEQYDLANLGNGNPEFYALLVLAMAEAYKVSDKHIADPATYEIPLEEFLSKGWAEEINRQLKDKLQLPLASTTDQTGLSEITAKTVIAVPEANEPLGNTTHFSIVDRKGNMVALTQTLNHFFGSAIMVPEMGIVLNNEMYDFTYKRDSVNLPGPGKIPRSRIAPLIVLKEGKPIATLGTPGGARIPAALAQILIQKIDFEKTMDEAVEAPCIHYNYSKKRLAYENRIAKEVMQKTVSLLGDPKDYQLVERAAYDKYFGGAQGIWIGWEEEGSRRLEGGASSRRGGVAIGY